MVIELVEQILGVHVRVPSQRFDGELEGGRLGEALGDALGALEAEVGLQGLELVVEVLVALLTHAVLDAARRLGEAEARFSEEAGCLGRKELGGYYSS